MPPSAALEPHELRLVLESMREGIQVLDREFRYVYVNAAAAAHGRRSVTDLIGRRMQEMYPGIEQTPMFAELTACMLERSPRALPNEFTYPDGTRRNFELRIEPCDVGIVVLSIDVTDGRKLEEQLRHSQKMEAVGRLAGSVAHDFNNLLSVILGYSALLLTDLKPIDPIRADIELIRVAGEKAAALTQQLLAFSRQQVLTQRNLSLNQVVRECEPMLRRLIREDIELTVRCERDLHLVRADQGQLDQVLLNLAINARDAMPKGGKLTIETQNVDIDQSYSAEHFDVAPGCYVMLAVSDTGIGMDKATQARIFEPFFTTKELGQGTGLGLSTVFGIVRQSGGTIWVYSEPCAGASFKVYLPKSNTLDLELPKFEAPVTLHGTETILLVEDQDEVRRVAQEILIRYGYHVLSAQNAGEALLTCERHPRAIHLLLTDIVMPQMNGRELAERLRELRPDLPVLFMSGYTDNSIIVHGTLDPGVSHVQKPLLPETLVRRVREVLDAATRPRQSRTPSPV